MKKLLIMTILYTICIKSAHAQEFTGVQFIKGLSWQQILDKAKSENKYIFVDCYATWCGPCKWLDQNVYPLKTAGEAMNSEFICIRLQMDKTIKDDDTVKSNYGLAAQLAKDYDIHAYPTLLFFNPEGVAVHKVAGSMDVRGFLKTASNATNPQKQYYTLLNIYKADKLGYAQMPLLAGEAGNFDEKLSAKIADDYLHNYLDKLPPPEMLTKENVAFLNRYKKLVTSNDAFFKLCLDEPVKTDTLTHQKGFAEGWIGDIAYQEVLNPMINAGKQSGREPDWGKAKKEINKRFGKDYSAEKIVSAKIVWYFYKKDGSDYAKCVVKLYNRWVKQWNATPTGFSAWRYNDAAFAVFQYDNNKGDLETALNWMERINAVPDKPNAALLDTQANLLYKLGRKDEAIEVEAKAAMLNPDEKDIAATLAKMKAGQATWPDKMN